MSEYRRRYFSAEEIATAKAMRLRGVTWRIVAETFQCDAQTVRSAIDPDYRKRRNEQIRQRAHERGPISDTNPMVASRRVDIPLDVDTDRHARCSAPRTLTSILCGDPAPGQSALDKKRMRETTS